MKSLNTLSHVSFLLLMALSFQVPSAFAVLDPADVKFWEEYQKSFQVEGGRGDEAKNLTVLFSRKDESFQINRCSLCRGSDHRNCKRLEYRTKNDQLRYRPVMSLDENPEAFIKLLHWKMRNVLVPFNPDDPEYLQLTTDLTGLLDRFGDKEKGKELFQSIQIQVDNFTKLSDYAGNLIDKGQKEMGELVYQRLTLFAQELSIQPDSLFVPVHCPKPTCKRNFYRMEKQPKNSACYCSWDCAKGSIGE